MQLRDVCLWPDTIERTKPYRPLVLSTSKHVTLWLPVTSAPETLRPPFLLPFLLLFCVCFYFINIIIFHYHHHFPKFVLPALILFIMAIINCTINSRNEKHQSTMSMIWTARLFLLHTQPNSNLSTQISSGARSILSLFISSEFI